MFNSCTVQSHVTWRSKVVRIGAINGSRVFNAGLMEWWWEMVSGMDGITGTSDSRRYTEPRHGTKKATTGVQEGTL